MSLEKIKNLTFEDYNPNISYLGSWSFNDFRTKLNIHNILPFNFQAFKHDKMYFLIWSLNLSLITLLFYKLIVDLIFFKNCIVESKFNPFKWFFALFCFIVVVLMTPIYYFRFKK